MGKRQRRAPRKVCDEAGWEGILASRTGMAMHCVVPSCRSTHWCGAITFGCGGGGLGVGGTGGGGWG